MLTRRISPRLLWSLALALLAAVALIAINEAGYRRSSQSLAEFRHLHDTRNVLTVLMQHVLDAEASQRGYLLTRDESYHEPYDRAEQNIQLKMAQLRELYAGRTPERQEVTQLGGHISRKLAEMDVAMQLAHAGNISASQSIVATEQGRAQTRSIRASVARLASFTNAHLAAERERMTRSLLLERAGVAAMALVALIAGFLYLRQNAMLDATQEAQQHALQRERNQLEQQVRERTASLGELATHLQDVREAERGFLARELHDELGALLTAAKLDVARLRSRLADAPEAMQRLQHLTSLLDSGIALKRRIIEELRPSSLSNLGLEASLEILGREVASRAGIAVEMQLTPVPLDESRELIAYRVVQESLANVEMHAAAHKAVVTLRRQGHQAIVEVSDDGKGFDARHVRPTQHGLAGMRHRVEASGGQFSVHSSPAHGTALRIVLPLAEHAAERDAQPAYGTAPVDAAKKTA